MRGHSVMIERNPPLGKDTYLLHNALDRSVAMYCNFSKTPKMFFDVMCDHP